MLTFLSFANYLKDQLCRSDNVLKNVNVSLLRQTVEDGCVGIVRQVDIRFGDLQQILNNVDVAVVASMR